MAQNKPDLSDGIWASTGTVINPGAAKTVAGWTAEIPPSSTQNWWQERADEMLVHLNEQGIAVHDILTDYPVNAWAKGSDGEVYYSLQTPNINQDPTTEAAYWELLSFKLSADTSRRGRLVKYLTTSGTLTINDSADDKVAAYLTSTEIKSGEYLAYAYGAGSAGNGGDTPGGSRRAGGGGGGAGGVDRSIITINSSTAFVIGSGGVGSSGLGTAGGDTTISTLTGSGGGAGSGDSRFPNSGGSGAFRKGQGGGAGHFLDGTSASVSGGNGGGPSGGDASGGDGGLGSGGGGGNHSGSGGDGGDGYIEIYEWVV